MVIMIQMTVIRTHFLDKRNAGDSDYSREQADNTTCTTELLQVITRTVLVSIYYSGASEQRHVGTSDFCPGCISTILKFALLFGFFYIDLCPLFGVYLIDSSTVYNTISLFHCYCA